MIKFQPVSRVDREVIARLGNCVKTLAHHKCMLFDTSIIYAFEASSKFAVSILDFFLGSLPF